jgi:uncharacterized protein YbaA (DUF1428 family)
MTYVEGFLVPVPAGREEEYRRHAAEAWGMFREFGILRQVEAWGDDVPEGKVTDFRKAVKAEDGETVVFAWFEHSDRAARDAANARIMSDPRMEAFAAAMPFDGKRMVMGGFESIVEEGTAGGGYVDGILLAVPTQNRQAYLDMAREFAGIFREYGAVHVVENWGDDVPDGTLTDFRKAVKAEEGEQVVFSWIEWPSKAERDETWGKIMADERMSPQRNASFDGKRMFWGGFRPILDERAA